MVNPLASHGLLLVLLVAVAGAVASAITSPIHVLNDPAIVDADEEGIHLVTEIRKFAESVTVLDSTSELSALLGSDTLTSGQLVIPEQEAGSLSSALGSQSTFQLGQDIQGGLHLIVHDDIGLITQITGWSLLVDSCGSSASQNLSGGGFGQGPSSLPYVSAVQCVQRSSLPDSVDGVYASTYAWAWTTPYGSGRITYMGADYFNVKPEWPELLESSLSSTTTSTTTSASSTSASSTSSTTISTSTTSSTSTSASSTSSTTTSTSTTSSTSTSASRTSSTTTSTSTTSSTSTSSSSTSSSTTSSTTTSTSTTSSTSTSSTTTSTSTTSSTSTSSSSTSSTTTCSTITSTSTTSSISTRSTITTTTRSSSSSSSSSTTTTTSTSTSTTSTTSSTSTSSSSTSSTTTFTSTTSTSTTSTSTTSTSTTSSTTTSTSTTSSATTSTSTTSTSTTSSTTTSTSTTSSTTTSTSTTSTTTISSATTSSTTTSSTTISTSTTSTSATSSTTTSSTTTSSTSTSTSTTSGTNTYSITTSATVTSSTQTTVTTTRTKLPEGGLTEDQLKALEEERKEEAAAAVAEAETAENDAVKAALKVLNNTSQQPGLLGEVSIETDAGQVRVAALSMESLADAEGPAEISAGSETGVSAEVSMELLGEVASAAGAGDGMILLSMSGLTEDAASSLATDDVRAVGARRLASALRSQPISIHFRTADGTKINVQNLTTPMKIRLKTDDPNATCAFWDKSAAQWSSEGVQTLSSKEPGFIHCSTTHLSIFAGIIEVAVRSVLLRLECSTLGLLLQLEALEKLLDGEWLGRPATWVAALMVVVFGILLVLARRLDQYHLRKLPLNQRELLLLRLRLDGGDAEGLAGCAAFCAVIDAVFHFFGWLRGTAYMMLQRIYERRFDLLFIAAVHSLRNLLAKYVVHRSIGLLQVYRSSTAPGTARVLQSAFGAVAPENPEVENGGSRRITQMRRSPSMRRDSQTALTQAHALNRFVQESGAGAAQKFLRGNVVTRVGLLFPAVHGWVGLRLFSISHSNVTRVALFSMKAFSAAAFDAVWFSTSAQPGSDPACSPAMVTWTYVGQAVITGVVSLMVSDVVILMFSKILIAKVKRKTRWTDKEKSARRKGLTNRTRFFLCFAAIYNLACLIYIYLFIANTREGDGTQWMLAIFWWLLQDCLFKPLALAAILGNVSSLALYLFPDVEREVEEKWCQASLPQPAPSPAWEADKICPPESDPAPLLKPAPPPASEVHKICPPESDPAALLKPAPSPASEVHKICPPESDPAPLLKPAPSPASEAATIPISTWRVIAASPIHTGEASSSDPASAVMAVMAVKAVKAAEDDDHIATTALRVLADEKEITEGFAKQTRRREEKSEAQSNCCVLLPGQLGP